MADPSSFDLGSTESPYWLQAPATEPVHDKRPRDIDNDEEGLSESQKRVVRMAKAGRSFFFTGDPGTGKSYVLTRIVKIMSKSTTVAKRNRPQYAIGSSDCAKFCDSHHVYVTATTGIAACAIGGTTLHKFVGLGLVDRNTDPVAKAKEMMQTGPRKNFVGSYKRWMETNVLIIDECSMLDPYFFDFIDRFAREIRHNKEVFGGIQVILTGDFFQLPPVYKSANFGQGASAAIDKQLLFESDAWKRVVENRTILLTENFRQTEREFLDVLADVRHGLVTSDRVRAFLARCKTQTSTSEELVEMHSTRAAAGRVNDSHLLQIAEPEHLFSARDWYKHPPATEQERIRNSEQWMAPEKLKLKIGAQVMLIMNLDTSKGLCNGATGTVIGFDLVDRNPIVRFHVHTFYDDAEPIDGAPMVKGVAVKSPPKRSLLTRVVIETIKPSTWCSWMGNQQIASREQIPLILAWAITIHKSQGMTLEHSKVSVDDIFEKGQFYVAISRSRTMDGLVLTGYRIDAMIASQRPADVFLPDLRVVSFYESIQHMDAVITPLAPMQQTTIEEALATKRRRITIDLENS